MCQKQQITRANVIMTASTGLDGMKDTSFVSVHGSAVENFEE